MLEWIFDPAPPSGQQQGAPLLLHTLGADVSLDTLVREVIQNSYDQMSTGDGKVIFTLHSLDGEEKAQFLDAISWSSLEPHLSGDHPPGPIARRLSSGLDRLNDEPLILLRIDDSGADGLTGSESAQSENFNKLCRGLFNTSDAQSTRLGSYGLGKSVLWIFSSLLTVLFSSTLEGSNPRSGFRVFGRSELPSHGTQAGEWRGPGFLGKQVETPLGKRAESIWDDESNPMATHARLTRPSPLATGTSIVIVGFFERGEEDARSLESIARDLLGSSVRWFWRPIGDQSLSVQAKVVESSTEVFSETASVGSEVSPFRDMVNASETVPLASSHGQIAERMLEVQIPKRTGDGPHPPTMANVTVRVRRPFPGESHHQNNRVALMRSKGMVVDYRRPSRSPIDGQPYHAMLLAGGARDDTEEDRRMAAWLRAAEPPTHRSWTHETDAIRDQYARGTREALRKLWRDVDRAITELCDEQPPETPEGPRRLARLFPMGGHGGTGPGTQNFRVDQETGEYSDNSWRFSARVIRRSNEDRAWGFDLRLQLKGETGAPRNMDTIEIADVQTSEGEALMVGSKWRCVVPASCHQVTFTGESLVIAAPIGGVSVSKSTAQLRITPSFEGEGE